MPLGWETSVWCKVGARIPLGGGPSLAPLCPSRVPVAALPGRMVGTCCSSCGSAVSCKKEAAAAAAGAGGGGGEEPDLSGSGGLEANIELPQSRPGAGRAPLPRGALPAGQMIEDVARRRVRFVPQRRDLTLKPSSAALIHSRLRACRVPGPG